MPLIALTHLYTYIPDVQVPFAATLGRTRPLSPSEKRDLREWQLPNSKTKHLANHVILLADQYACQYVRFFLRADTVTGLPNMLVCQGVETV